ncbi:hypothetical protein FRC17_003705, partial [Serendipita sp. 399]
DEARVDELLDEDRIEDELDEDRTEDELDESREDELALEVVLVSTAYEDGGGGVPEGQTGGPGTSHDVIDFAASE